jgi:hypothetical protein
MRSKWMKLSLGATLLLMTALTYTFSANITTNAGVRTEFGQGIGLAVACDSFISASLTSKIDPATGNYVIDGLTLSDLSTRLHDRTVKAYLLGADGSVLNNPLSFSVASDGLTYTTTSRSHVDSLDAFTAGKGPIAEMGSSSITFNGLFTEESTKILASDFKKVNLETSGFGNCSVPSSIRAVEVYIDAPLVQGSYIAESYTAASLTDDYNATATDNQNCLSSYNTGSYSFTSCKIILPTHNGGLYGYIYGGALTSSSTPTSTGSKTNSAAVYNVGQGTTITPSSRKNYVGFWWSAGSLNNYVKFYRGSSSTPVITITGDDVYRFIPDSTTATLRAIDSTTVYAGHNYYGHPINRAGQDPTEPVVFIHFFAVNGFNFDKVLIGTTGNGFEYDNFTVANLSTTQLAPKRTLVLVGSYSYTG